MKEQFDVICFHPECIVNGNQLLHSWESESDFHFQNRHQLMPIHRGSNVFKKIKLAQVPMNMSKQTWISTLRKKHEEKKVQVIKQLDASLKKIEDRIVYYFQISQKPLQFQDFYKNLTQNTQVTGMYLTAANWLYNQPNLTLQEYLQQIIQRIFQNHEGLFQKMHQDIIKSNILFNTTTQIDSNLKKEHQQLPSKIPIQNIRSITGRKSNNQKRQLKNRPQCSRQKNPELIAEICSQFIGLSDRKKKLGFKTISIDLRQKLENKSNFYNYTRYIFRTIFRQIQQQVISVLGFKRVPFNHIQYILPKFKEYQMWLRRQDAEILTNCLKYFLDIETNEDIGFYQIYVIYLNFITSISKIILDKKNIQINYNTEPAKIRVQITCLYFHYGNLKTVVELLNQRYLLSVKYKHPESIIEEFKKLLIQSYQKFNIKDENCLSQLLETQYDNQGSNWIKIRETIFKHLVIRIKDNSVDPQISQQEKKQFQKLVQNVISQKNATDIVQNYQSKNERRGFNRQVVVIDSEDEYHVEYSFQQRPCQITSSSKWEVKRNTKVVKLQVIESNSEDIQMGSL